MSDAETAVEYCKADREAFLAACRSPELARAYLQAHLQSLKQQVESLRRRWDCLQDTLRPYQPIVPERTVERLTRESDLSALPDDEAPSSVSLDIFDTCLVRMVAEPEDIFRLLGDFVEKSGTLPSGEFARLRKSAEDDLRSRYLESGEREDVSLQQIYRQIGKQLGWEQAFEERVIEEEIRLEKVFLRAVPELRERAIQWHRNGVPLAYASEMYMESPVLRTLLEKAGFPVDGVPILSSGETGCSKGTGKLYEHVLDALGQEDVLHIGDNAVSDGEVPKGKGLNPCLVSTQKAVYEDLFANCLKAVATGPDADEGMSYWERFGFTIAGPLHMVFSTYLYKLLAESGRDRIFFLSRDGWFPRKVFQRLQACWGEIAEDEYVYASREFLGLGSMLEITGKDWDFILKPSPLLQLKDVFERLGIEADDYVPACEAFGLGHPDRRLTHHWGFLDPADRDRLYHAICQCIYPFNKLREQRVQQLHDYLAAKGLFEKASLFADVGWAGSSFRAISRMAGPGERPQGAYFALFDETPEGASDYFTAGAREPRSALLKGSVALLEFIFGAPEASVEHVEKCGNEWIPVLKDPLPAYDVHAWNLMEQGLLKYVDRVLEILPRPPAGDGSNYIEDILRDLIFDPQSGDLRHLGPISHGEGWGTRHRLRLLPEFTSRPESGVLHEAFAYCPWKPGLSRMLDEFRS